jgi:hypothetical protein
MRLLQFDLATADSAPESYYSSYLNGIASLSVTLGSYTLNKPNAATGNVLNIEDNHPVYNRDYFGVAYVIDSSPQYPELLFNLSLSATFHLRTHFPRHCPHQLSIFPNSIRQLFGFAIPLLPAEVRWTSRRP